MIAFLVGKDPVLEQLWARSGGLGIELRDAGFRMTIGPGFSTYWDESPFASIRSIARSVHAASSLAKQLPTVPSVVWRCHADLDRWAAWIGDVGVDAICIDFGSFTKRDELPWVLDGLDHLHRSVQQVAKVPRLIASGPFTPTRIAAVASRWTAAVTIASKRPWLLARQGQLLLDGLRHRPADRDMSIPELVEANSATFLDEARRAKQDADVTDQAVS
jgi:hypothetical protein